MLGINGRRRFFHPSVCRSSVSTATDFPSRPAALPHTWPGHRFAANNQKTGFGLSTTGWGGGVGLGGSHASISGSPLEEVARDLLVQSTSFLTETIAAKNITERVAIKAVDLNAK
jgi:hypothetical protein